ncbi:MAG: hypothetical protein ACP5LZ_04635 [Fervidicoccaceae archaeon]
MKAKQILGAIATFLGIVLMFYAYISSLSAVPKPEMTGNDAYMFVLGTIFLLVGPGFWIGEVPREVAARVKMQAMAAKKEQTIEKKEGEKQ